MAKYSMVRKIVGDKEFVFVTRGRAKTFTPTEIEEFLNDVLPSWGLSVPKQNSNEFDIPNVKMFSVDLRAGLAFCAAKYGTTTDAVKEKAAEIFPHLSLEQLTK